MAVVATFDSHLSAVDICLRRRDNQIVILLANRNGHDYLVGLIDAKTVKRVLNPVARLDYEVKNVCTLRGDDELLVSHKKGINGIKVVAVDKANTDRLFCPGTFMRQMLITLDDKTVYAVSKKSLVMIDISTLVTQKKIRKNISLIAWDISSPIPESMIWCCRRDRTLIHTCLPLTREQVRLHVLSHVDLSLLLPALWDLVGDFYSQDALSFTFFSERSQFDNYGMEISCMLSLPSGELLLAFTLSQRPPELLIFDPHLDETETLVMSEVAPGHTFTEICGMILEYDTHSVVVIDRVLCSVLRITLPERVFSSHMRAICYV